MTNLNPQKVCDKVLYSNEEITKRCKEMGAEISSDYAGKEVTFISILNGSFMFTSELLKNVNVDCRIDFIQVSTYGANVNSSGNFMVKKGLSIDIENKDVVIIEDIVDTGFTMINLIKYLEKFNPNSIKICTMIDKPHRRTHKVDSDYVAFTLENDAFIVGYGLDYAQRYRNLPYIGVLKESIFS